MTIKELIQELSSCDQGAEVYCYNCTTKEKSDALGVDSRIKNRVDIDFESVDYNEDLLGDGEVCNERV